MPFEVFKEIKVKCNHCNTIVVSKSETEWTECPCGQTAVMGIKSFMRTKGDNYTDLSILSFDKVPPFLGWDSKPEDYKTPSNQENK